METYIGLVLSVILNLFFLVKMGGRMVQGKENTITEEEIRQMVDAGGDNGSIDENEKEMINNIFELSNISAGSIATHRTDIVAVPLDATLEDIKNVMAVSRAYQSWMQQGLRVAYSGVEGAFAHIAAGRIFPESNRVSYRDFKSAYDSVISGESDHIDAGEQSAHHSE